jgi:SAM-dependent methyltransferase
VDKRNSYSQERIVREYEQKRFHGRSGELVNQTELNNICSLLIKNVRESGIILDSPCGTGRVVNFLKQRGMRLIGLDYSMPMLKTTIKKVNIPLVRADLFHMPFKDSSLNCIISLRFMFHYVNIEPILHEMRRILKDNGMLIFDTFKWSPKANFLFGHKRVFIHKMKKLRAFLKMNGMEIVDERYCFFFSPMIYRILPLRLAGALSALEKIIPSRFLVRAFWCVKKLGG